MGGRTGSAPLGFAIDAGAAERNLLVAAGTAARMDLIHVCLNVADLDESVAFYEQFGFEESWSFAADGTEHRYLAADNGAEIQLSSTPGETEFETGTAWDHLALGVEDVDATFERVDHHGVVQEPSPAPEAGTYTAFVEDPDGHVVELVEPLED
jgi:lactoylglutathione lyase